MLECWLPSPIHSIMMVNLGDFLFLRVVAKVVAFLGHLLLCVMRYKWLFYGATRFSQLLVLVLILNIVNSIHIIFPSEIFWAVIVHNGFTILLKLAAGWLFYFILLRAGLSSGRRLAVLRRSHLLLPILVHLRLIIPS